VSRRRWIADEWSGDRAAITGANARHLAQVLRAKVGQTFELAYAGEVRLGTITELGDGRVSFTLGEAVAAARAAHEVTVALAIFKFDRFEWAIEKLTELGVTRIVPVVAQRTDAHLVKAAEKRAERWRRIAHEASQQSRRLAEPVIEEPVALKKLSADGRKILLSENEESVALANVVGIGPVTLAIGPEGGWTADEERYLVEQGWQSASLGSTVLRAETAAIAAVAVAMNTSR
jgi:16S rRNA (uracil1498-N3)-methyltransferase